jgi:hypothetical protein
MKPKQTLSEALTILKESRGTNLSLIAFLKCFINESAATFYFATRKDADLTSFE